MKIDKIELNISPFAYVFTEKEKDLADFFMAIAMTHAVTNNDSKPIFEVKFTTEREE